MAPVPVHARGILAPRIPKQRKRTDPAHKRDYDWQFPDDHMETKESVAPGAESRLQVKASANFGLKG